MGAESQLENLIAHIKFWKQDFLNGIKIGIAGHPEGSPDIPEQNLEKAMIDKKPYADYIVTQWLLDSQPIVDFISKQKRTSACGNYWAYENI